MKKTKPELEQVKGWNAVDGVAARCAGCREWITIGKTVYWRKVEDGSEIRCRGCADK